MAFLPFSPFESTRNYKESEESLEILPAVQYFSEESQSNSIE